MPVTVPTLTPDEQRRSLENLRLERDAIVLYESLAAVEKDAHRARAFRAIAANERRHADIWAARLREAGAIVPDAAAPRARVRFIILLARLFGTRAVSELVQGLEGDEEEAYAGQDSPEVASIVADEREHAEIWKRMDAGLPALTQEDAATRVPAEAPGRRPPADRPRPGTVDRREESWHRAGRTGTLRAAIFGINDGLVSNLSLVVGVAAAGTDDRVILLAGIAGLLAGAFSMAAGEYISMQSQRELFERQIAIEREEMRVMPDAETDELAAIYEAKGLDRADARALADRLMEDPEVALDTKVREELGLDPDELGSAWGAAASSFVSFGVGALVPLAPYAVFRDEPAIVAALILASLALFAVGAGVSLLTGRSALFSGARQVAIGAAAAAVTFAAGALIGVQIAA